MEDREVFDRHLETTPVNIFDTQVASAFLEPMFSPGYAQLVSRYLEVDLDKHATRSDWLARPLTAEQLRYALEDVDYLLPLYRRLTTALEVEGRLAWCAEEQQRQVFAPASPADYFATMRQARRLSPRQLARLKVLTEWREKRARRRDLPRGRVIKDEHLLKMSAARGSDRDVVFSALPEPVARRFWRDLVDLLEEADRLDEDALPARLDPPLTQREGECLKKLKAIGQARANGLGIAEELLSRKRDLEACVRAFTKTGGLPEIYAGWRHPQIGADFEAALAQYCSAAN
jgi:ribonuclease D